MNAEKIIAIAKREHNTKRSFLVVNRYQGKHVPISPDKPFQMFSALADLTAERYRGTAAFDRVCGNCHSHRRNTGGKA